MTKKSELLVGLAMFGVGIGYLYLTMQLPRRGAVDATFFPYVLAGVMIGLGALQCIITLRRGDLGPKLGEQIQSIQKLTVLTTLGLVALYIFALRPVGFPIATTLFLFMQFIVLTPTGQRPNLLLYVMLAMTSSAVIFGIFRYGFNLLLPAGPLTNLLP